MNIGSISNASPAGDGWDGQPGAPMGCTLDRVKNVESMMLVSVSSLESPNIDVFEMFEHEIVGKGSRARGWTEYFQKKEVGTTEIAEGTEELGIHFASFHDLIGASRADCRRGWRRSWWTVYANS